MIENSVINDMVTHRAQLYQSVEDMGRSGFNTETLTRVVTQGMSTAINSPSFLFDTYPVLPRNSDAPIHKGKWKTPFDKFSLVVKDVGGGAIVVLYERPPVISEGDTIRATIIMKAKRGWAVSEVVTVHWYNDMISGAVVGTEGGRPELIWATLQKGEVNSVIRDLDSMWSHCVGIAVGLLVTLITTTDVVYRPANTTSRTPIQETRSKSKTWQYHLLKLKKVKGVNPELGGHHATPVEHDVRGHERHLTSGKVTWVSSHKRGDPGKGRVDKDYQI